MNSLSKSGNQSSVKNKQTAPPNNKQKTLPNAPANPPQPNTIPQITQHLLKKLLAEFWIFDLLLPVRLCHFTRLGILTCYFSSLLILLNNPSLCQVFVFLLLSDIYIHPPVKA